MEFSHLSLPCEIIILQDIVLCILEVVPMFCSVFVGCSCCCKGTLNILLVYFRKSRISILKPTLLLSSLMLCNFVQFTKPVES